MPQIFKKMKIPALRAQLKKIDPSDTGKIAKFKQRINDIETGKVKVGDPHIFPTPYSGAKVPLVEAKKKKVSPADAKRKQERAKKRVEVKENKVNNKYIDQVFGELLDKKTEKNEIFLDGYDLTNEVYKTHIEDLVKQTRADLSNFPKVQGGFGLIEKHAKPIREQVEARLNRTLETYREGGQSVLKQKRIEEKRATSRGINTFVSQVGRRRQFTYEARETFNQPNEAKFGKDATGNPRSRKDFAHRFRGKTEQEISSMIDQEVKDRTPEQRGAFVGRASRELISQDITNEGVAVGDRRIGAGEFIASQLAKKDIEQIVPEPSKRGFISAEFTPDNMRTESGAISQEEEGVLNIKKRREQQYQKEWSADGTTLRNYGFGVLDQEEIQSVKERNDVMLNAVAESIQILTQGKSPVIEADEKGELEKKFEKTEADLQNRRFGGIKPVSRQDVKDDLDKIQTEFRATDAYIQTQNNYALQNRFVDIFQKEPKTLQYLEDMKDPNGEDFVSGGGGVRGVNYVNTELKYFKSDTTTNSNPYLDRFNTLKRQGIEPLQFLLNTANNNILKFDSVSPIAQEVWANGVGSLAVMNEVMLGGRIAFIGHTFAQYSDPNVVSGASQSGASMGDQFGYINVFNNPYQVEENSIKPLVEQNPIVPMSAKKDILSGVYAISQRDTSYAGVLDLTGGNITLQETGVRGRGAGGDIVKVQKITQTIGGKTEDETRPRPIKATRVEQIRKGTYLPTARAYNKATLSTKQKIRQAQLKANSFPTVALGKRKMFGFQMF